MDELDPEIVEHINSLPKDELIQYGALVRKTEMVVHFLGVGVILLGLCFTNIFTIIGGIIGILGLSSLSCVLTSTAEYIKLKLDK